MIHVEFNSRVLCVGECVQLYRFPGCDVTVSEYEGRVNVSVHHHGPNADELMLTADDCVMLWAMGIGTGELHQSL